MRDDAVLRRALPLGRGLGQLQNLALRACRLFKYCVRYLLQQC